MTGSAKAIQSLSAERFWDCFAALATTEDDRRAPRSTDTPTTDTHYDSRGSFRPSFVRSFLHLPSRTAILADICQNFSSKWLSENWAPWQRSVARISKIVLRSI